MTRLAALAAALLVAASAEAALTLTATPVDCHTIDLAWTDPDAHPGQLYRIERSEDGGVTQVTVLQESALGQRNYRDASCVGETQYQYRLVETRVLIGCGDVDGSGGITIGDALVIAQYDVGLRTCGVAPFAYPASCDVNVDGDCNVGDALRIAQCAVGLRPCAFLCGAFSCGAMT